MKLQKSFESFKNTLNEGKVTYKRQYTENHPAKNMYSSSKIRAKILERIGERKITKMAFERILRELNANPRYGYRNRNLFEIQEDTVSLSSRGMKMLKASKINEAKAETITFKVSAKDADGVEELLIQLQDDYNSVEGWDWSEPNDYKKGTMKLEVEVPKKQVSGVKSELTSKTYKYDVEIIDESLGLTEGAVKTLMHMIDNGESDRDILKEFPKISKKDLIAWKDSYINPAISDKIPDSITEASQLITEGTRSQIGIILSNGKIEAAYCHYDGYPEHNGEILKKHFTNPKKVKELMNLASNGISGLDKSISGGPNHSFAKPTKGETIFYGRDRGENHDMITKYKDAEDYRRNAAEEFAYLYNSKTKQWSYIDVYDDNKEWIVLESNILMPGLIMPINEKVTRYKGMKKVAKTLLKLFEQDLIFSPTNNNFTQSGKNNLYITLYILLEALTDANFHSDRSVIEKPLKKYMKFVNMDLDPSEITGLTLKTADALNINFSLKKSHAQDYCENVYSKISSAGDFSGPSIAYGVCLYLETYGDTAAGALASSQIIKQQFSSNFDLPRELS